MLRLISFFAALALSAFASVTNDFSYASHFIDKGTVSGPLFINALTVNTDLLNVGVTLYAPSSISVHELHSQLGRTDLMVGHTFSFDAADLSVGNTFKHYVHPAALAKMNRSQPFVKIQVKPVPVSLVVRYDVPNRSLNAELGVKYSRTFGAFKVIPSAYAGYTDTNDALPNSITPIAKNNRYYGGGVGVSRKVGPGDLSVGLYLNRSDHSSLNTTRFWTVGYSVKL